jgi:transcriptional regulator with XRE-family HTH domain
MQPNSHFAERLRRLRRKKGVGLKRAAPQLGVSYTYLSKIENNRAVPSADLLERIASYYETDKDELLILADKIPDDVRRILRDNPREALDFLRRRFGDAVVTGQRPRKAD